MTGAPLLLTPEITAKLQALRQIALLRVVDIPRLMATIKTPVGKAAHMAQMTEQTIAIPGPWRFMVTYSVESGHPIGTCRHMSMSIDRPERVPNPTAIWMIAELLGFVGRLEDCNVWLEDLQGHGRAVNVVQPVRLLNDSDGLQ